MSRSRRRRWAASRRVRAMVFGVMLTLCSVGIITSVLAQPAERGWRETLQLDTPLLAAKRLENARGLIEQEAWDAAITALADLEKEFPNALVNVAPGRYVNVTLAARLLRLQLPAAGLEAYRQQIDGWAEQQLESALATGDDEPLRRIVSNALASRAGDKALNLLAEHAWERGDVAAARRLWTQMLPVDSPSKELLLLRPPAGNVDRAAVLARLILCSLAEGDVARARAEVDQFADLFPDAEGWLAGQQSLLVDILESLVDAPQQWTTPVAAGDWPTFAGGPTRNGRRPGTATIGRPLWTLPLKPTYIPRWEHPRVALPEQGLLSRYPVTWQQGLFLHDGTTILGLNLANGKPLWPLDDGNATDQTPGKVYPPFPALPNALPWTPVVGVPRYTSTVHEGRLYALMGPSVLTLPAGGHQASPTRLVCINLAQGEGLLEWFHVPDELFDAGWMPTGTPIADTDHLYVPLVKSEPQIGLAVACLQTRDGSVVWQQTVGQALREALGGRVELGHQLLTLADDRLFYSTDFGGIAAMETRTGRIDWVVTYPSIDREAIDRSDETAVGLMPPVYHEGTLFAKSNDSEELLAIDAASGYVLWRQPTPGPIVNLLGVVGSTLVVSGHQLWVIDVDTGRRRWRFGYDDAAGYGYGRGVIVGEHIIWPLHDELFVVGARTGLAVQRVRLYESLGVTGGNLIVDDDHLLISGANHLTAFELNELPQE